MLQFWPFGTGTSPPAVNLALSPEIAVTVGSARTRDRPARSSAFSVKLVELPMPAPMAVAASACGCSGKGLSMLGVIEKLPSRHSPLELMPSCLIALRETSETTTLTMTWSRPRIDSELITAPLDEVNRPLDWPTKALAMSTAWVASEALVTSPTSRMELPAGLTSILALGSAERNVWRSTLRSRPTSISSAEIWRPSASMTNIEVEPSAMPMMKILRAERTTALATFGLATKTSLASRGSSTTMRATDREVELAGNGMLARPDVQHRGRAGGVRASGLRLGRDGQDDGKGGGEEETVSDHGFTPLVVTP